MNTQIFATIAALLISLSALGGTAPAALPAEGIRKLKLESVEFFAPANVSAFNIKGVAQKLEGEVVFAATDIKKLEVKIPVESLTTKMSLRDKHMREKIFQTKEGKLPDLVLTAADVKCSSQGGDLYTCPLTGSFEIQGLKRPFQMTVAVKRNGNGGLAEGEGVVKLSDYGIAQPEQLGIKVANEVKLKIKVLAE